jgi:putative salt-induced outer membrane protein
MNSTYCVGVDKFNQVARRGNFTLLCAIALSLPGAVFAEEAPKNQYNGNVELGYINTSGNTQTQSLNAKAKVVAAYDSWQQAIALQALNSSDKQTTTAERYSAQLKTDYRFTKKQYAYGLLGYENDRFSGYDYRASISLGYGQRVIDEKKGRLELEGGPGVRNSKLSDDGTKNESILRLAGKLSWQVAESSLFEQDLSTEIGTDTAISKSSTSLSTQVVGNLAMKLSYTVQYTNPVPQGLKKRDSETSVTLVYKF